MKKGIGNGTIGSSSTQPHSVLLHESCDCNYRLAPDFRDQTAGLAAWLLDILFCRMLKKSASVVLASLSGTVKREV